MYYRLLEPVKLWANSIINEKEVPEILYAPAFPFEYIYNILFNTA